MKNHIIILLSLITLSISINEKAFGQNGSLEIIAELPIRPGDVAVSKSGRVFATIHSLGSRNLQLIEIKGRNRFEPFPSKSLQKNENPASDQSLDSPLGLIFDKEDRLWVIDMGQELGKTRLWCFDIDQKKVLRKIELPESVAPKGSFIQDVAIDYEHQWAYLADINNPGIIALDMATETARRFGGAKELEAEDIDMVIDGELVYFGGKPARVAVDPITISLDGNTVFFGAMNGTNWYSLDAQLFREGASDESIQKSIVRLGVKPISDGASSDGLGNHYFTDLTAHAITRLNPDGTLEHIIQDDRLKWPDNAYLASDGSFYISVNQLNTTPAFTGGEDEGKPPYYIYRFKPQSHNNDIPVPDRVSIDGGLSIKEGNKLKETALYFYAFWNTGKQEYLDRAISEKFIDRTLPEGRPQGPEGPRFASDAFRKAVPDLRCEVKDLLITKDKVTIRMVFRGTHLGAFAGVAPSGKPIEFNAIDILRIEEGKIVENWHLEDNLSLFQQLGVVKL
ncbi:L-dopachrome tautomerase-related protein [Echinicola sp. 20G]|uniref:L-dopachrome tautomerase-related protein n=1 Tax=Echinicola sp. 20G TaxID=2781961 RepID=UPI0019102F16|nr:L-dopachrome tautomerase-related protein [Echinicola sp. 20G]